jgi:hypothetical protein
MFCARDSRTSKFSSGALCAKTFGQEMSTVLRAFGADFAVDEFLATSCLVPISVFLKGEPRFPSSQPDGRKNELSGAIFSASDADFSDFSRQLEETQVFLHNFDSEIRALKRFPGLDGLYLDFGAETKPPYWSSFRFPSCLLKMVGDLEIDLELSVYPTGDDDEPEEPAEDPNRVAAPLSSSREV